MKHSFKFWLFFVLSLIMAIYFTTRIVIVLLGNGAFRVSKIMISSKNGGVDQSAITEVIGIKSNTKSFSVKLDDALIRITSIPDIEFAAVRRLADGNLQIKIKKRLAIATWMNNNSFYPLTANGSLINKPQNERPENALVFKGSLPPDISYIVETMKHSPRILSNSGYLEWIEGRRWNITTINNTIIMLPETNFDYAIKKLNDLENKNQILERKISVIDMRDPERVLIK